MNGIRDRVRELRRVPASSLKANPRNFRRHDDYQTGVMRSLLAEIGFAGASLAWETPSGEIELLDGHLRGEIAGDAEVPVLILDITTREEADRILLTHDPVGQLAKIDPAALQGLLGAAPVPADPYGVQFTEDLRDEAAKKRRSSGGADEPEGGHPAVAEVLLDQAVQLRPAREYIVVMCADDGGAEWERLKAALDLGPVRRGGYRQGSQFDAIGTQRVVKAADLLAKIEDKP